MNISLVLWKFVADSSSIIDKNFNIDKKNCGGTTCPTKDTLTSTTVPHIINTAVFLIGAISIIMIIVGGLRYVISAGNSSAINSAKDTILYSVVGLVLASAAYAIVIFVTGKFGIV